MKFFAVPILIFLMATQAFSKWVLLLEFRWNQDYIAHNLCVNKARPALKCGGKCQLMKRLAEDEKENAPAQNPSGKSGFQEVLFTVDAANFSLPSIAKTTVFPASHLRYGKTFSPPCPVFHPPLV